MNNNSRTKHASQSRRGSSLERSGDRSPQSHYCEHHPNVDLMGHDGKCPECDNVFIQLLKRAAKTLERRADRVVNKTKSRSFHDNGVNDERSRRRSAKGSKRRSFSLDREDHPELLELAAQVIQRRIAELEIAKERKNEGEVLSPSAEQDDILRCWETDLDCESKSSHPLPLSHISRRQFTIGQVAQPSEIDQTTTSSDELIIKISHLNVGDPVWVRRSKEEWTYAILKEKGQCPDDPFKFTVNEVGSTKTLYHKHLPKFVKLVAEPESSGRSAMNDHNMSMYTLFAGIVNDCATKSDRDSQSTSIGDDAQYFGDSMYVFSGMDMRSDATSLKKSAAECVPKSKARSFHGGDECSRRKTTNSTRRSSSLRPDRDESDMSQTKRDSFDGSDECSRRKTTNSTRRSSSFRLDRDKSDMSQTDQSIPSFASYRPTSDKTKPNEKRVSFALPENKKTFRNRSMPSVMPSVLETDDADVAAPRRKTEPSISVSKEENEQIKAELHDVKKTKGPKAIPTKKLNELNMGDAMDRAKRSSFHSALNSIHKRSSVFVPSAKDVPVVFN